MAEDSINLGHCIQFHHTSILAKTSGSMEHTIRELIGIELHPDYINREEDFSHSRLWNLHIKNMKE
jgi:hypothetical protein